MKQYTLKHFAKLSDWWKREFPEIDFRNVTIKINHRNYGYKLGDVTSVTLQANYHGGMVRRLTDRTYTRGEILHKLREVEQDNKDHQRVRLVEYNARKKRREAESKLLTIASELCSDVGLEGYRFTLKVADIDRDTINISLKDVPLHEVPRFIRLLKEVDHENEGVS